MWNLLRHLWSHFSNEDLTLTAAALAYTTVLSMVPFLAVTLTALNYFDALDTVTPKVESVLLNNFNGTAGAEGVAMMKKGISRIREGRTGSLGALLLILVATRLMFGLEKAFHKIWLIKNQRPLFKRLLYYWLFLLLFPFMLAAWVWFASHLGKPFWESSFLRPGYIVTFVLLYVLQVWLPSVRVGAIQALIGTAASVILLFFLEKIFKILNAEVFSYGKVYGSLAAIPASLLYVFLVWMTILWGVALTASLQKGTT